MIAKYIRVERIAAGPARGGAPVWRTLPRCERVEIWDLCYTQGAADQSDAGSSLAHFHIAACEGVVRGCRVTYMGQHYDVRTVADSQKLRGIELGCIPSGS